MNTSKVYFTNLRTTPSSNLLDKMERLVKRAGIANIDFKNQFVAIKIHFGEPGNLAYIRPNYAARLVSLLRELGAKPFLTDCNTLYSGPPLQRCRSSSKRHGKWVQSHVRRLQRYHRRWRERYGLPGNRD